MQSESDTVIYSYDLYKLCYTTIQVISASPYSRLYTSLLVLEPTDPNLVLLFYETDSIRSRKKMPNTTNMNIQMQ